MNVNKFGADAAQPETPPNARLGLILVRRRLFLENKT